MIENQRRMQQIRDFQNLPMQATDLDGIIDVKGRAWVLFECKFRDTELTVGQTLALTRMCADLNKIRPTIGIVARHDIPVYKEIDCNQCLVSDVWYQGQWHYSVKGYTLGKLIECFINGGVLVL